MSGGGMGGSGLTYGFSPISNLLNLLQNRQQPMQNSYRYTPVTSNVYRQQYQPIQTTQPTGIAAAPQVRQPFNMIAPATNFSYSQPQTPVTGSAPMAHILYSQPQTPAINSAPTAHLLNNATETSAPSLTPAPVEQITQTAQPVSSGIAGLLSSNTR